MFKLRNHYLKNFFLLLIFVSCSSSNDEIDCNKELTTDIPFTNVFLNYQNYNNVEYTLDDYYRIKKEIRYYYNYTGIKLYEYDSCGLLTKITNEILGFEPTVSIIKYDDKGNPILLYISQYLAYTYHYKENEVETREYRSYNINTGEFGNFLNQKKFKFDERGNLIELDDYLFDYDSKNNMKFYSKYDILGSLQVVDDFKYYDELNPFYDIFVNTYGRKNSFLLNDFVLSQINILGSSNFSNLVGLGFSRNMLSNSNKIIVTIMESENNYAKVFKESSSVPSQPQFTNTFTFNN